MRPILATLAAAALALSPSAVLAQDTGAIDPDMSFTGVDTDTSGLVSWLEFSLVFSDYTEAQFQQADLDGDGELNQDEYDALVLATGTITTDLEAPEPQPVQPSEDSLRSLTYTAP